MGTYVPFVLSYLPHKVGFPLQLGNGNISVNKLTTLFEHSGSIQPEFPQLNCTSAPMFGTPVNHY